MQSQTQILMRKPLFFPKEKEKETPEANQMTLRGGKKLPEPQLPASKGKGKEVETPQSSSKRKKNWTRMS